MVVQVILPVAFRLATALAPQFLRIGAQTGIKYGIRRQFGTSKYLNRLSLSRGAKHGITNIASGAGSALLLSPFGLKPQRSNIKSQNVNSLSMPYGYYPRRRMFNRYRSRSYSRSYYSRRRFVFGRRY